jgi:hypothetical protein
MMQMIAEFGRMGVVEARPGVKGDPLFPETLFVETLTPERFKALQVHAKKLLAETPLAPESRVRAAGWESEAQLEEFRSVRVRHRS